MIRFKSPDPEGEFMYEWHVDDGGDAFFEYRKKLEYYGNLSVRRDPDMPIFDHW
eukprot:CAMPEP_0185256496 /NCGR_PEP_ID=MMETSP1359-20130426/5605_1 /TAXON_ID=552665 /ORGANISM="Bigelowiella longifila, Strain CCMP242" /LENGTH=53 /DNA_ID=CAMNT_0027841107 /DNA_START=41 /DNA_END=199 /DNA_ORIENTATION=+